MFIKLMIISTTVIRITVGCVVVVPDPPSNFNNQTFIENDTDFVSSYTESNDTEDNLSSFSNESVEMI